MIAALYPTKQALKASIGKRLHYEETSMFGREWEPNTMLAVVGPSPYSRKWFAEVRVDASNIIVQVK